MVSRPPARPEPPDLLHGARPTDNRRPSLAGNSLSRTARSACCATCSTRTSFFSPFGIRSLSRIHKDQPFIDQIDGHDLRLDYEPGESTTGLFGGNSNWRGPIWFPVNYLLVEALERYHHFYGDTLQVECPTGSGKKMNLREVARELAARLSRIFPPKRTRPAALPRQRPALRRRSALARPGAVPRVLPRRHRRRAWAPAIRPAGRPWLRA